MIDQVLTAIFGSKHERDVKRMLPNVARINALEPEISKLSDDGLRAKTQEFRERLKPAVELLDQALKEIPRDDGMFDLRTSFTNVWIERDDGWKLAVWQATLVP